MTLPSGARLGPYEILAPIGAGGMGEVYRAKDTRLDRIVAIKVLPAHLSENPDHQKRFEREAKVISSLNHPNVCALYDIGHQDNIDFLIMEYLEGETLRTRLKEGPMSARKAVEIGMQIANGLGAAHEKGIVHRDLKPENIFLIAGDQVKILDFGLAHSNEAVPESEVSLSPTRTQMTSPGTIMGTVGYMSPEQVRGMSVDARSDIFAFGSLLYEMLSGKKAFHGDTPADTMTVILKEDPIDLTTSVKNIPPILDRIVRRCLEKRPESRFRTAQDLAFALETSTTSTSSSHPQLPAIQRRPGKFFAYVAGLLILGAAAAIGLWVTSSRKAPVPVSFRQLTFKRGNVMSARFAPDGQTVIYGAALGGKPVELFSVRTDGIESRSMGMPADILGISKSGEMALLLNRHYMGSWVMAGTLAKASLSGGSAREILENVNDGDISDDGQNFVIVRQIGTSQRLEYPIGKILFETHGYITNPVISPDGKEVAFLEHPIYADDRGFVSLYDSSGKVHRLSPEFSSIVSLAWVPSGNEVWFSGSASGGDGDIWAARPGAQIRLVYRAPAECRIEDINANGQTLLTSGERQVEIAGLLAGDATEKDLTTYGDETIGGVSADGSILAATRTVSAGLDYQVFVRRADTSDAVLLGTGQVLGITSDGKWVLSNLPSQAQDYVTLFPVGPGEPRRITLDKAYLDSGNNRLAETWTADGKKTAIIGYRKGQDFQGFTLDITNGKFLPVTPQGVNMVLISPDGSSVLGIKENVATIYPISGGDSQTVPGWDVNDYVIQWENSGQAIFTWDQSFPAKMYRLDLSTGKRELWKELAPRDPVGLAYGRMLLTPDGKHYIYRYRRILNRLYDAQGLK